MATFFRKIRRALLSEGKTTQYFKYAIGEIVLVVIGILIALQINNWNQANKDKKALKEYLVKVKAHTNEDLKQLEEITYGRTYIGELCKQARVRILNKTEDEDLSLFMQCGAAFADYAFKPNISGYEALRNSSYFGKINNTTLDSLLTKYHNLLDDIAENENSYNEYVINQEAYLSTQFDRSLILASAFLPQDSLNTYRTPQSDYVAVFKEYTQSATYRNVISLAAWQFDAMVAQYNQLKQLGQSVVNEIDTFE